MSFEVLEPGPLTTVQDLGRPGLASFGVPEGGAMDRAALRTANRLAGNGPGAPALEYTVRGPRLRWRGRRTIEVAIAGDAVSQLTLAPGDVVDAGPLRERVRGYLAVRDGFAVPLVLGGRGTCLAGSFGGHQGRRLQAGDRLAVNPPRMEAARRGGARAGDPPGPERHLRDTRAAARDLPRPPAPREPLRVLAAGAGTAVLRALLGAEWRVAEADRAGMRLQGPAIPATPLEASRPTVAGAIQVTGEGQPIVLLRDHPTIGGYPLVAVVIGADLDRCAQLRPGAVLRFRRVTEASALAALR
jgi:biotin-dependent carboxylase-like uncharacterized protein